jgi:hypothetical protein
MLSDKEALMIILGLLYLLFTWLPPEHDDRRNK